MTSALCFALLFMHLMLRSIVRTRFASMQGLNRIDSLLSDLQSIQKLNQDVANVVLFLAFPMPLAPSGVGRREAGRKKASSRQEPFSFRKAKMGRRGEYIEVC